VASLAVFLASDDASFINGEDVVIDGGQIRGPPLLRSQSFCERLPRAIRIELQFSIAALAHCICPTLSFSSRQISQIRQLAIVDAKTAEPDLVEIA
jgi:hypothetical protein